jgi:hypothetical protein
MQTVAARSGSKGFLLLAALAFAGCDAGPDGAGAFAGSSAGLSAGMPTPLPAKGWDVTGPADAGTTPDAAEDGTIGTERPCAGRRPDRAREAIPGRTWRRDPYLQSVGTSSAVVVWRAEDGIAVPGCVAYAVDGGPRREACAQPSATGQYEVLLEGLEPASRVVYQASTDDGRASPEYDFFTAPARSVPVRFVAIADGHKNVPVLQQIARQGLADGADFFVHVGDSVSSPEDPQFDAFFRGIQPLASRTAYWPVIGNHELRDWRYFDAIVVPGAAEPPVTEAYYAVRWGNVWMASLELVDFYLQDLLQFEMPETVWLKAQLESPEAAGATWKVLFIHQAAWNLGWGSCTNKGDVAVRNVLMPLAAQYGVTAVFSGHMHGYEHGLVDGVDVFITGGAGGGLDDVCRPTKDFPQPWMGRYVHHRLVVDAGCDEFVVEARDLDDALIDRVAIPAPQVP